jgi:MtN3 and saliva related transmembrane protein
MEILPLLTVIFGIVMCFGYFSQTYKIFKRKSAKDISLWTYILFASGITVWLIYGITLRNVPLIVTNAVGLVGAISVVTVYFLFKH